MTPGQGELRGLYRRGVGATIAPLTGSGAARERNGGAAGVASASGGDGGATGTGAATGATGNATTGAATAFAAGATFATGTPLPPGLAWISTRQCLQRIDCRSQSDGMLRFLLQPGHVAWTRADIAEPPGHV